jgi:hypothetical protein
VTPGSAQLWPVARQKCKLKCFNNMPSESSSKSANGSNTCAAAEALKDRGFVLPFRRVYRSLMNFNFPLNGIHLPKQLKVLVGRKTAQ